MLKSCFKQWRQLTSKHKRQKETLKNFPSVPSTLEPKQQLERLGQSPLNRLTRSDKSLKSVSLMMEVISLEDTMITKMILEKINVCQILLDARPSDDHIQFKLVICVPNVEGDSPNRPFCEMMRKKFTAQEENCDPDILTCFSKTFEKRRIDLCVRYITR